MASSDDRPTGYRTPHEPPSGGAGDVPREALGRHELPFVGPVDLELALGRPLRLDLGPDALDLEPGSGLVARAPELPTLELRRLRIDLVQGTVSADADALGPFFLRSAGLALRRVLRALFGWQPGRGLPERLVQNLPLDPWTGARRLWAGPARASLWLDPQARLAAQLRGDRAELVLTHAAELRVLGLVLPILGVRLLFADARLAIDPGPAGPLRRALLRLAAWIGTRWLRRRLPAAMTIPGYDLLADEQRRTRLLDLLRRLRGGRRRGGPSEQVPRDSADATGSQDQALPRRLAALRAELGALRLGASAVPEGARVLARIPLGARGEAVLATDRGADVILTKTRGALRLDAPAGLYLLADELPELAALRLSGAVLGLGPAAPALEILTAPGFGPLLRALAARLSQQIILPRLPLELLRAHGLIGGADDEHVVLRRRFGPDAGVVLRTAAGAALELRHGPEALTVHCAAGLQIAFEGLALIPDLTLRRLELRWDEGALRVDASPDLGDFGALALAQLLRQRVALPPQLGLRLAPGPTLDPLLAEEFPVLAARLEVAMVGALEVRLDPDDQLALRLAPAALGLTSARALVLVAPDLQLALRLRDARYSLRDGAIALTSDPPLGDYLTALIARCVARFALPPLRARLPLWPEAQLDQPWRIAQVPPTASGPRAALDLPVGAGLALVRGPDALELRPEAPLQITPEDAPLVAEFALRSLRYEPARAELELGADPPPGPLLHELLRRALARFVPQPVLGDALARAGLPRPGPLPPPLPPPPGVLVWETLAPRLGALRVSLDAARTLEVSLDRHGARIGFGAGATLRAVGLGVVVLLDAVELSFLPWTLELRARPALGELEHQLLSHALRGLFAAFMRHFWPSDRSPRAGHDTLLALGGDKPWGPLKICVARGGAIDLRIDREGLALRSAAGLFVTGEAIDWLPDFYLHELALQADGAVRLGISGIVEQAYHEAAPVSPITQAVLAHLYRVLVAPRIPAVWSERLGLPRLPAPPAISHDPARIVLFEAELPGGHGPLTVSAGPGDTLTLHASEVEIAVESKLGLVAAMPGLRLALQLRGARYHLQTGEVQVGGLGQLENALIEAVLQRAFAGRGGAPGAGVQAILDRFPLDAAGRRLIFQHPLVNMALQPGTGIRVRLDDQGLHIDAEPALVVDGPGRLQYSVCGLRYRFDLARFEVEVAGDTSFADLFEGVLDRRAEKRLNDMLLPLLPAAMRTPGYHLTSDPRVRDNVAELIRAISRRGD